MREPSAELAAAGITDPALRRAYAECRALNARHGRTYFLATRLLTPDRRPAIHALYGFARYADEIVDDLGAGSPVAAREAALDELGISLVSAFSGEHGDDSLPVATAVADTVRRYGIDPRLFSPFLTSMRMDTHVTDYPTVADLDAYVHGSAAVIGLQVLPVLGSPDPEEAAPRAAALGVAFQLTNFLRDVGEDLDRGRVYLPGDELAAFGADRELLVWCRTRRRIDPRVRRALAHLVARTRAVYRRAEPGIGMLAPESRDCVRCAFTLYGGILDEIVAADYAVLHRRVRVPGWRKAAVAVPGMVRAAGTRARSARSRRAVGRY